MWKNILLCVSLLMGSFSAVAYDAVANSVFDAAGRGNLVLLNDFLQDLEVDVQDEEGMTPLHHAVEFMQLAAAQLLLVEYRANPNLVNEQRRSPLHLAVSQGCSAMEPVRFIPIIRALLRADADIDATDINGNTPLHLAAEMGTSIEIVEVLLENGASDDIFNRHNQRAKDVIPLVANVGNNLVIERLQAHASRGAAPMDIDSEED